MPAYRYSGRGAPAAAAPPDADSALDALSEHILGEPNVAAALEHLQRSGFEQRDGRRQQGTGELAHAVRQTQRGLKRRYSFEHLTREFARQVRSAMRNEIRATEQHFRDRATKRSAQLDDAEGKLQELAEHAGGAPSGGGRRMRQTEAERRFEELYLQVSELKGQARTDQEEERHRLDVLDRMPTQPVDAAKALEEYPFLSDDAAETVRQVSASRDRMAELAASEWRHAFRGREALGPERATSVAREMRELDRLEGRLRGGRLGEIDPRQVRTQLGVDAEHAVESLQRVQDLLRDAGYLVEEDGRVRLSPRGIRRLGHRALQEMFTSLKRAPSGEHDMGAAGPGARQGPSVRPYEIGDPFHLHLNETLLRAAARGPGVPLALRVADFMVHESEASVHSATVLMIDVSLSMQRHGRMVAAKKVALALDTLIRTRFPKDTLELVAFSTRAQSLALTDLPDVGTAPTQPFTNMQDALRMATRLLRRHRGANRQVVLITDGEPTATLTESEHVRTRYPPDEHTYAETLQAVHACTAHGILINIIMLDQQPERVEFVRRMAHVNRGRALFCTPETIGQYVIFDYLRGKRLAVAGH